ncbi:MAG: glycosyltransferase [Candidatus Eisenbacteria bacterium]
MRVLVAGTFPHLPGHLATGTVRAFEEIGHEVRLFDYLGFRDHAVWKLGNRARLKFRPLGHVLYPPRRQGLLRAVDEFRPQLLFVIGGEVFDARTIQRISRRGIRTALWIADDPYQRGREIVAAPAFDLVYVFDPYYREALRKRGVARPQYLPMACDPKVHRPIPLSQAERRELGGILCFVGTWYPNRDRLLREIRDLPLSIWGGGWPLALARRPLHPLAPHYRGRASGGEMVRIYSGHRAVLNIQHPQSKLAQNMRTFEGPACGALTLTEWTEELPNLFREGEEIVSWRSVDELRGKLHHLLARPEKAQAIGARGRERAHQDHTYRCRMKRVLEDAGLADAGRADAGRAGGRKEPARRTAA